MIRNDKNYIKLKLLKKTLDNGLRVLDEKEHINLSKKEMAVIKEQYLNNLKKTIEAIIS